MRTIGIERIAWGGRELAMTFFGDGRRFSTRHAWEDVDFAELERRYGRDVIERVCFHIAAFELNKLVSFRPEVVDLGDFARLHTPAFERVWRTVVKKVWAQWRWEHGWADYEGPRFASRAVAGATARGRVVHGPVEVLAFCGGGKDSLVAMKLLERAGIPFSSFAYAHSIYGAAAPQHALIDGLLDHGAAARRHRQTIDDDLADAGVVRAETPASIFAVLPVVLMHGYRHIVLAHERSANVGNLIWDATGEDVNHQWGKSREAEALLNGYLATELLDGVDYFSVLQPIHDLVIFHLLGRDLDAVRATHSCNVEKPWCGRCAKCAYVWLGYQAFLPRELVDGMFGGVNLFDLDENQRWYRQMLGLAEHTPFECIGQVDEARWAFQRCRERGLGGRAMAMFEAEVPAPDGAAIAARFCGVDETAPLPPAIAARVMPALREAARAARAVVSGTPARAGSG